MKEKIFKFLFGDKPIPEETPKILFKEEWENKATHLRYRVAGLIVEIVPDYYWKDSIKGNAVQNIINSLYWARPQIMEVLEKTTPEPLKSKEEFIRFLCEYILEKEKGGSL